MTDTGNESPFLVVNKMHALYEPHVDYCIHGGSKVQVQVQATDVFAASEKNSLQRSIDVSETVVARSGPG